MVILIRKLAILFSFLLLGIVGQVQAANLYAVIVGDTAAYDVRPFIEQDVRLVREEMAKVAYYTGLELQEMVFVDENVKGSFIEELEKLQVGKEDVIVFYWNGHGVNVRDKGHDKDNVWPYLMALDKGEVLDHFQVTQMLMKKNPKFLLSVAASRNSFAADMRIERRFSLDAIEKINEETMEKNYRTLFLGTTGTLIISSSSAGEYSWVNPEEGGEYYTLALLNTIHHLVKSEKTIQWELVLDHAKEEVIEVQTPHYQLIKKTILEFTCV